MAYGVNPAVKGVEPAGPHALVHAGIGEAGGAELGGCDHAVLATRNRGDPRINTGCVTFLGSWARFVNHPLIVPTDPPGLTP
jgi:hypothetical protein